MFLCNNGLPASLYSFVFALVIISSGIHLAGSDGQAAMSLSRSGASEAVTAVLALLCQLRCSSWPCWNPCFPSIWFLDANCISEPNFVSYVIAFDSGFPVTFSTSPSSSLIEQNQALGKKIAVSWRTDEFIGLSSTISMMSLINSITSCCRAVSLKGSRKHRSLLNLVKAKFE